MPPIVAVTMLAMSMPFGVLVGIGIFFHLERRRFDRETRALRDREPIIPPPPRRSFYVQDT